MHKKLTSIDSNSIQYKISINLDKLILAQETISIHGRHLRTAIRMEGDVCFDVTQTLQQIFGDQE